MADGTLVHGRHFSFSSIGLQLDTEAPILGFKAIKYPFKVEEAIVYGAGSQIIGRTRGKVTMDDGSLTVTEKQYRQITQTPGWLFKTYTLVVQYADFGQAIQTDTLVGLRFKGADPGGEEGTDALMRELPFSLLDLLLNGVSIFTLPEVG